MFSRLAEDVYVGTEPFRSFGVEVGRVTTVVRLPDGGLFVHTPCTLDEDRRAELDALGPVRFVVAPNWVHGWGEADAWAAAWPDAELHVPPGLARRSTLAFDGLLGSAPDPRWADALDQTALLGHPVFEEVEFFHRPSGTLVLGDLCYRVGEGMPPLTRLLAGVLGVDGRLAVPRDLRATFTNRAAVRETVRELLAYDVERVVVGHRAVVTEDAAERLRRALAPLLE